VSALAVHGGTLYVAGHFTAIGGHTRGSLAAVDLRSGDVTPWNPLPDSIPPDVSALAVNGHTIVVGGGFTVIGGQPRSHVAALDAESGTATAWNPETNGPVLVIACSGVVVYLGGAFTGVGTWQRRNGLAAMDLTTGMVTQWNPQPDGFIVLALAAGSGRVYVGGDFRMIGGQVRAGLAALDTLTGVAVDWNPQANSYVDAIVLQDQTVYVGGNFTRIGGQSRNYLAALDASTGAATPWNPGANGRVFTLAHGGDTLYAGGYFTSVGGQPRSFLAAIDAASGSVTDWNPSADEWVNALAISGHVVYAGGAFQAVGGQSRNAVAALDLTSGEALAWNPDLAGAHGGYYPEVYALAVADGRVYVGGDFATVGGRPRDYFAELNGNTAAVTDWDPSADGVVWSVMADGNSVYVGGRFTSLGGLPCAGLAAVAVSDRPFAYVARQLAREPLLLAQNAPNPVRTRSLIRFAVPSAGPVTLSVFDLQGRRMATLFDHQQLAAGQHEAALRTEGWPAGWYVYRLDAGQITATRTMLVVR